MEFAQVYDKPVTWRNYLLLDLGLLRRHGLHGCLWIDNAYVAEGMVLLLADPRRQFDRHCRLWEDIRTELATADVGLTVQHVASHQPLRLPIQDLADWIAYWNVRAGSAFTWWLWTKKMMSRPPMNGLFGPLDWQLALAAPPDMRTLPWLSLELNSRMPLCGGSRG